MSCLLRTCVTRSPWRRSFSTSTGCSAGLPLRLLQFKDEAASSRIAAQLVSELDNDCSSNNICKFVDMTSAIPRYGCDMIHFLQALGHDEGREAIERAIHSGKYRVDVEKGSLIAPIFNPPKVICVGLNYHDHCAEFDFPVPSEPVIFCKLGNAVSGPQDDIVSPPETKELDYEVELAMVIGRDGFRIPASKANSHIAGYTVANDVSARDWQLKKNSGQWLLGKSFNGFCPIGPVIVTPEALKDPHNLGIRCRVNNATMQESNTSQLIHKCPDIIAFVSRFISLTVGDLILTGTPPGVGAMRKPPCYLQSGDVVECEVDGIGCIRNRVV